MRGIKIITIKTNNNSKYELVLRRPITIIAGDSGTGKSEMISIIEDYKKEGSCIRVDSPNELMVLNLDDSEKDFGVNWKKLNGKIVFIDESSNKSVSKKEFANLIKGIDAYFVIVGRGPYKCIPYGVKDILIPDKISYEHTFKYAYPDSFIFSSKTYKMICTEDECSGFFIFRKIFGEENVTNCHSKSNVIPYINNDIKGYLFIVDECGFGSEIEEVCSLSKFGDSDFSVWMPESMEYLILKSNAFGTNTRLRSRVTNVDVYKDESLVDIPPYESYEDFWDKLLNDITVEMGNNMPSYAKGNDYSRYNSVDFQRSILSVIPDNVKDIINNIIGR